MEIFIENKYFNFLDDLFNKTEKFEHKKNANFSALISLLTALPVNSDISYDEVISISRSISGTKNYKSIKEITVANAIKNQRLNHIRFNNSTISNYHALYFFACKNGADISRDKGVLVMDWNFDGSKYFDIYTIVDRSISNDWDDISKSIPPCNSMLVIDKYIFGEPFEVKLNSLIELIKLFKRNSSISFHLTIIYSQKSKIGKPIAKDADVEFAYKQIKKIKNIECELIPGKDIPTDDRLIFTNYTSGNIGHPFARRKTRFNQNFLAFGTDSSIISENYEEYKQRMRSWESYINKLRAANQSMPNLFKNRIFSFEKSKNISE